MKEDDLVFITCPLYPEYKEQPSDQSKCELFDCPKCKEKMWLSQKKKGIIMLSACLAKKIELGCYNCMKKIIIYNMELFKDAIKIEI